MDAASPEGFVLHQQQQQQQQCDGPTARLIVLNANVTFVSRRHPSPLPLPLSTHCSPLRSSFVLSALLSKLLLLLLVLLIMMMKMMMTLMWVITFSFSLRYQRPPVSIHQTSRAGLMVATKSLTPAISSVSLHSTNCGDLKA